MRENEWNGRDGRNADSQKENWNELDKPTKIRKTRIMLRNDDKDIEDKIKKYLLY